MAALTNIYVDPAINANSGTGTIGDPYGDLQYALNTATHDATHGTQINIKLGTAETLSAALSFSTYGTSLAEEAPLVIRGYTSAANDGGVAIIDGNGGAVFTTSSPQQLILRDLHIRNGGSSTLIDANTNVLIRDCKIDNTSGTGVRFTYTMCSLVNCEVTDCGIGAYMSNPAVFIHGCYFKFGANRNFTHAINIDANPGAIVTRNIISCGTSGDGIYIQSQKYVVANNSILANGSTGGGIRFQYGAHGSGARIFNNIVEGFSGSGGSGFDLSSTPYPPFIWSKNAAYNNATNYANIGDGNIIDDFDNEVLSTSPFAKSGSDTFANRFVYFAPVDTGNIRGGALQ
jgi:hypothetical protein